MVFLDAKSDIAFKKLFGEIAHKNVLINFLNSVLQRTEGSFITDIIFNDPNNIPETPLSKLSIVDIRCTDQHNNQYIIEIQVSNQRDYASRSQYYSSLALSRQLASGEKYSQLVPVIFIGVLDFKLFQTTDYLSHHLILDSKSHKQELKHLEFHFIELAKFNKKEEELDNILEKWIFLLKYANTLQQIPISFKEPSLKEAFGILEQSNWSKKELEAYDRYIDAIRCEMSVIETAIDTGIAKGIVMGRSEGKLEKAIEIAKELLDVFDTATIAKKTGLSIQQVENLKK